MNRRSVVMATLNLPIRDLDAGLVILSYGRHIRVYSQTHSVAHAYYLLRSSSHIAESSCVTTFMHSLYKSSCTCIRLWRRAVRGPVSPPFCGFLYIAVVATNP
jgi:hypothetical protein